MKKILSKIFPIIPVGIILGTMIFSHSCANTTTPPSGGPKDTIPPLITEIKPLLGQTNVPVNKTKLEIKFNEYVVVKDPKSLYLYVFIEHNLQFSLFSWYIHLSQGRIDLGDDRRNCVLWTS